MPAKPTDEISLRVVMVAPPAGVMFSQQTKKSEAVDPRLSTGKDLVFTYGARVVQDAKKGSLNILGPMVMGTPDQRFLYICVGTCAGQLTSPWTRRVKIPLKGITPVVLESMRKAGSTTLEARYNGSGRDGSPACATVPLLDGWKVVGE